jgi:hypothetical protein
LKQARRAQQVRIERGFGGSEWVDYMYNLKHKRAVYARAGLKS